MSQDVSKTKTAGRAKKTKPEDKAKFKKALGSELASDPSLGLDVQWLADMFTPESLEALTNTENPEDLDLDKLATILNVPVEELRNRTQHVVDVVEKVQKDIS